MSKSLQVSLPMVVSKSTVGPVGAAGGRSCAMVDGASGSASCCAAGVAVVVDVVAAPVAGGVVEPGVVACAKAMVELRAIVQVRMRSARFGVFIPC